PPCAAGCSRAQGPSGASPARFSARRTPGATDNTSPRSPRSGGLRPPWVAPARPEHQPVAASQRSLQACIASLPLQSSLMSKTYLKSDHFSGGGSHSSRRITAWLRRIGRSRPHGARRGGLGQVNSAGRDVAEYNHRAQAYVFNVFGWLAEAARG